MIRKIVMWVITTMLLLSCAVPVLGQTVWADEEKIQYDELIWGMQGPEVLRIQQILYDLGYLPVEPDGIFGDFTYNAVQEFQLYNGLYVTGTADQMTQELIYETQGLPQGTWEDYYEDQEDYSYDALYYGDTGEAVLNLQEQLRWLGYLEAIPDGIYGRYTSLAVQEFQMFNNLDITGEADSETMYTLYNFAGAFHDLEYGMSGNEIFVLQNKLAESGYLEAIPDGIFGFWTQNAVEDFQKANSIEPVSGIADKVTVDRLLGSPLVKPDYPGSTSEEPGYPGNTPEEPGYPGGTPEDPESPGSTPAGPGYPGGTQEDPEFPGSTPEDPESPGSTPADYIEYGGTYLIENAYTFQTLNVDGYSADDGANVIVFDSEDYGTQKWVMQADSDGYYHIRNLMSWKCLDMVNGNAQQSEYDQYSETQKWQIYESGNGAFYIINAAGTYLSAAESSGWANAIGTQSGGSSAQTWLLTEVSPGTALDFKTDGTQEIGIRSFEVYRGNVTETTDYYNIQTTIDLPDGGYYLSGGSNYSIGLKVMYVNSFLAQAGYLSMEYYNYNRYDGNTVIAVRAFQEENGLESDGIVGINTWLAMGYSEYDFYNLGSYTTPLKVYAYGSSRDDYVMAMLNTAYEYLNAGTGYADGASGVPGTYVDCSGLIFQCLYAAGINPDVNIIDHARVVYEYSSTYLGNDWRLGTAVASAMPGDLIFYGSSIINHVAIYAGNGMIIDSWPGIGVSLRNIYSPGNILKIVRVF